MMRFLRGVTAPLAIAMACCASFMVVGSGTAVAAGGGCRDYDPFASVSYGFCIGDDGRYVYGDAYIRRYGGDRCERIRIWIYERQGVWHTPRAGGVYDCQTGHLGPESYRMTSGSRYYTKVHIYDAAGELTHSGNSPESWI
jgi:hypothetical protein